MNLKDIQNTLQEMFDAPLLDGEDRKIIFWTDVDEGFKDYYDQIELDHVKIIHLHKNNQFYVKYLLEEEDPTSSYLIYTTLNLESNDNWLYDIVQYSQTFYADRISLIMKELKIDESLRHVVQTYEPFFGAKERRNRLKRFEMKFETKEALELAMMNVLCRQCSLDFQTVLRTVLMDTLDDESNQYLKDFNRFFNINTFWSYVKKEYAYVEKKKSLYSLFKHLVVTALSQRVPEEYLKSIDRYIADVNRTNIYVFIDQWMHHKEDYKIYNEYARKIEEDIHLKDLIQEIPVESFQEADVFPYIDRALIIYITNSILNQYEDYETYIEIINIRRNKHFFESYKHIYEALYYTIKMFQFHKKFSHGIPQGHAKDIYDAYINEYYLMDTYYRKFYVSFDAAEKNDLLLKLQQQVEKLYSNWFMAELSAHWSQAIQEHISEKWELPGINNQQQFYNQMRVKHENDRVFVIISDAMRYEIGVELKNRQNNEIQGSCELDTMLGVVPSITKLGMAALLPHKELTFGEKGEVLINGERTSSIDDRENILQTYESESIAIHYEDIFKMNKSERRETFKGKRIIYIYHDTIDATGDRPAMEMNTFNAAEEALDQLSNLLRIIRNDLSGTHVYVTSDHGFIYKREELEIADFMNQHPVNVIDRSRRHILSDEFKEVSGQHCIQLSSIVSNDKPLYAYVPKATIRYRVQGAGANYVHGGASLQEIVIPKLYIHNKRTGQQGAEKVEKTSIKLTSNTRRITNSIFSLHFFQVEPVGHKIIPRTVVVYMTDENDQVLSNEEIIIGDLLEKDPKKRVFHIQFMLKRQTYDKDKTYYLVIEDTEASKVIERIPFSINLGFVSDFDF